MTRPDVDPPLEVRATVVDCYAALVALSRNNELAPYERAGVERALCSLWQVVRGLGADDALPPPVPNLGSRGAPDTDR